ncbi:MAG: type II and III secretion system protein, partial [Selenomonadaceae bacterium]|nr:type II and III secretion system protein [Selenomonadaceae bacterium]
TTTEIEYRDAGIILKYTPRINADGTITATIHTEVSTPQYVEDLKAYQFNTRSADTTVTVRDGEPMVIGGLIGAEDAKSISKIPVLGDLPILGALFRNHRKSKTESELMIFLTAHVINGAGVGVQKNVRYSVPAGGLPHEILSNEH